MPSRPKRPGDFAQRGKLIVDILTGQAPNDSATVPPARLSETRRKAATKGGKARAKKLPAKKRIQIAKRAALARWRREPQG
jgi:hypothetical protein